MSEMSFEQMLEESLKTIRNGEGEVVAGIAIMLKGENFQEVIRNVKLRCFINHASA